MKIQELPADDYAYGCRLSSSHLVRTPYIGWVEGAEFTSKTAAVRSGLSFLAPLDLPHGVQGSPSVISLLPVQPNLLGVPPAVWHERRLLEMAEGRWTRNLTTRTR